VGDGVNEGAGRGVGTCDPQGRGAARPPLVRSWLLLMIACARLPAQCSQASSLKCLAWPLSIVMARGLGRKRRKRELGVMHSPACKHACNGGGISL